jgi:Holliday junction resolvase
MGSVKRRAAKRDANERGIIDALRDVGATVVQLSDTGVPDLLVGFRGASYLLEVKAPRGTLTDEQTAFLALWRGQVAVIRSVDEALAVIGAT